MSYKRTPSILAHKVASTFSNAFRLLVLWMFLISCSDDDPGEIVNHYLVSSEKVANYSTELLKFGASQQGFSSISQQLQYDIDVYEIEYKTDYLGQEITASGLIGVPNTDEELPILSFQHGTIAADADAPTNSSEGQFYASFASLGYVALIPDFIGFGSSADIIHPYYQEDITAESIIDMIRAAEEFILANGINSDSRLFLAGYSEGGFATMATHKAIEEKYPNEFDLVASAPASGGYDLLDMKDNLISQDTYHQPFYLAYVTVAYADVNDDYEVIAEMFNEPYASAIPGLFDGSKSGSQINAELSTDMATLLTENFRLNSNTDNTFATINAELANNSPIDWQPEHPMYMYHGTADITVPYQNSVTTYDKLIDGGASTSIVSFTSLENGTHSSGIVPYVTDVVSVFKDLK